MKRKLTRRNKKKWSRVLSLPNFYRILMLNDRSEIKQKKRTKYRVIERFDLAYKVGSKGRILVPLRAYSLNKRSRVQDKPDGARYIGSIESFNALYNTNKTLEDIPKKSLMGG